MQKNSPYNSPSVQQPRARLGKATINLGSQFNSPKEQSKDQYLISQSKSFAKLKRHSKPRTLLSRDTSKAKLEWTPHHSKSRSIASLDSTKLSKNLQSKLNTLTPYIGSPQTRSPKAPESEGKPTNLIDHLSKDLLKALSLFSPIDVIGRAQESVKSLKKLGHSYADFGGILALVTKEIDDIIVSRQVLERKLSQLSRENVNLSHQLEIHNTQTKPELDPVYDSLILENRSLKLKVQELETELKGALGASDEGYTPNRIIRVEVGEIKTVLHQEGETPDSGPRASRYRD